MARNIRSEANLPPAAITLVKGADPTLADKAVRQVSAAVRAIAPDVETVEFSANAYEEGELLTLASGSLFSEDKLLIISGLEEMNDAFATDFEAYIRNPSSQVWVIVQHRSGNRGQRILKALAAAKYPQISAAPPRREDEKVDLVINEVRDQQGTISREAAQNLVSALGGDLGELLASARQLVFDSGGDITADTVHTFHRGRVETKPFEVAQALAERDATKALLLTRQAFATKVHPVVIVAAMATKFRLLAKVKVPGLTAAEMKVPSWQVDRARREARHWSEESLGQAILAIADADAEVKGESRTPEAAIELCIIKIARLPK